MNILKKIIEDKKEEVKNDKKTINLEDLRKLSKKKNFVFSKQLNQFSNNNKTAIIAEIKKASPSKGVLIDDFDHNKITSEYIKGGAACISILTEKKYFLGSKQYVKDIKKNFNIPVLNKDFFIDPYQVFEANCNEADCILVIVNSTNKVLINELVSAASEVEMDVLLEVHNEEEMETALEFQNVIIGINNRNLENFDVSIENTLRIFKNFNTALNGKQLISESGIFKYEDIKKINDYTGINNFLIGESLIKSNSISDCLKNLIK